MDKIIAIYGPTTSDKLGLALNLSKYIFGKYQIDSEVINVDSRKIYKEFKISQSLPTQEFLKKIKIDLFGTVSAKEELDIFDFQKMAKEKIAIAQQRGNLPILVGGSALHLLSILQSWEKGEKKQKRELPHNVFVFGVVINKLRLKEAVTKNVSQMFKNGLYKEFKELYKMSKGKEISLDLLEKTLGYRQFLEMAKVSKKSPLDLNATDLSKIEKWMIKDILGYAYHQTLDYKRFSGIHLVKDFKEAKKIIDLCFENHG